MRHFSKTLSSDFYEDLKQYIEDNRYEASDYGFQSTHEKSESAPFFKSNAQGIVFEEPEYVPLKSIKLTKASVPKELLDDICLPVKEPSFCESMLKIIDEKGLKDSAVYKKADIDRRLFSKMRSDLEYHPSKNTATRICLALELDIVQTELLLETAGYSLSLSDTSDLVVRYFIEHEIFDIISVNEAIDYFSGRLI